jgi:hypothetical protein
MEATVSRRYSRYRASTWILALLALSGCSAGTTTTSPGIPGGPTPTPAESSSAHRDVIPPSRQENPRYSYETDRDRRFADFLRENSGGMVRQAAVGIEREGKLRVQLDRSVSPDDSLPLTRSILAGARKDFPGKPFTLSVYDPHGEPILRARATSDGDVRYEVVHDSGGTPAAAGDRAGDSGSAADPLARSGRTPADTKFATWAEEHGKRYLRYVQADLERRGRLWFGVTSDVKPADVPDLTRSLLEGAHREFPDKQIVATVFDPDGERIGRAHLGSDGQVRWEQ